MNNEKTIIKNDVVPAVVDGQVQPTESGEAPKITTDEQSMSLLLSVIDALEEESGEQKQADGSELTIAVIEKLDPAAAGEEGSEGSSSAPVVKHDGLKGLVESIPRDLGVGFQPQFLTTETFTFIEAKPDGKPIAPLIILDPVFEVNLNNRVLPDQNAFAARDMSYGEDSESCVCDPSDYPNIVKTNIFDEGASFGPDGAGSFGLLEFTRKAVTIADILANAEAIGFTDPGNISQFYPAPFQLETTYEFTAFYNKVTTPEGNTLTLYLTDYMGYQSGDLVYDFVRNAPHIPNLPGLSVEDVLLILDSYGCGCYSGTCTIEAQVFYDPFMYIIRDIDGDTASNFILGRIVDDVAIAAAQQNFIDEADIITVGSNQQSVQAKITGSLIDDITTSFGADGGIVSNVTIEGGTTVIDSPNDVIRVTTAEGNVLEVTQSTGQYVYYLNKSIDNDSREGATDTQAFDKFHFQLTDFDFDQAESDFTVVITDDNPIINPGSLAGVSLLVDETNFAIDATANLSGAFQVIPGADGAQSIVYNLAISNANSGLVDTLSGQPVLMTISAGNIIGSAAGNEVFRLTINSATGAVTLNQSRAVVHGDPNNPNDIESLANNLVSYRVTVTDNDQDVRTSAVSIGNLLQFRDDAPTIQVNSGAGSALAVDETNFNINATSNLGAAKFTINPGADQAASIVYGLVINNINSGLVDSVTNEAVLMTVSGNTIIGASLSGGEVFRITVNNATGAVTLDQSRAVEHSNPNDPNDVVSIANNLVAVQVVVTDNDGDQAIAQAGMGNLMQFFDDGPSIQATAQPLPDLFVDETNFAIDAAGSFTSAFTVNPGGDQLASSTYSLVINASNTGFIDTQTGEAVLLSLSGSDIVGSSASGGEVFRISVNPISGLVSLNQSRAMIHIDPNNANEVNTLTNALISLQRTVVDGDGDSASASLAIGSRMHFVDDAPVAVNDSITVEAGGLPAYDLMLILDTSGSMLVAPPGGSQTRLDILKSALAGPGGLLDGYFDVSSALKITFVLFNNVGEGPFTFSGVNAVQNAKAYVNALTAGGGTALDEGIDIADNYIDANAGSSTAIQRAYLFSDGNPSSDGELSQSEINDWQNTLLVHDVDMIAVNIGGAAVDANQYLAPLANPSDNPPVIEVDESLSNLNQLLAGTIPAVAGLSGNLLANDDLSNDLPNVITQIAFAFPSVAEAQAYAAAHPEVSIVGNVIIFAPGVEFDTPNGNHLTVAADGNYTYVYSAGTPTSTEVYTYGLRDGDFDSSTASFTVNLIAPPPPTLTENQDIYLIDGSVNGFVRILQFSQIDTGATGVADTITRAVIPDNIAGTHGDVSPDGTKIYMVGDHFGYYDLVLNQYFQLPDLNFGNQNLDIPAAAFRLDGTLFVGDANTNALYTVNLATGALTFVTNLVGESITGGDITITDQGDFYLVTAGADGGLHKFNPNTGEVDAEIFDDDNAPSGLANLADGSALITDRDTNQLVRVDASGNQLGTYLLQNNGVPFDHQSGDLASRTVNLVPPVLLDMNGDGQISIVNASESGAKIDVNQDGIKDSIDWVSQADGILVYDVNHDGQFSGVDEINFTKYAENAYTDLQGLAKAFDSNHDSVLDAADNEYNNFYVWQDANQNAMSEAGEMRLLDAAGIKSINLLSSAVFDDVQGSIIINESSYTMADGESHMLADTALQYSLGKAVAVAVTSSAPVSASDALAALDSGSHAEAPAAALPALANEPAAMMQEDASVTAALQQAQQEANAVM